MYKRDFFLDNLAIAAALIILCGIAISMAEPPAAGAPADTPATTETEAVAVEEIPDWATAPAVPRPADQGTAEAPAVSPSELLGGDSPAQPAQRIKTLDVPLDGETQWAIYGTCEYDPGLFALVMAIAEHESGFDPETVGDGGSSLGMMQINTRWHTGRMEALGVTDLTDPVQCAAVAVDYIRELEDRYGFEPESHELCLAYNMGPGGARKAIKAGMTSTDYSREVMTAYQGYLLELEDR